MICYFSHSINYVFIKIVRYYAVNVYIAFFIRLAIRIGAKQVYCFYRNILKNSIFYNIQLVPNAPNVIGFSLFPRLFIGNIRQIGHLNTLY